MKKMFTALQLHEQKVFYWISSYKTVLKYMDEFNHILKPLSTGKGTGKRYYIAEDNLTEFLRRFHANELAAKNYREH